MELVTTQDGTQVQLFAGDFPRAVVPVTIASGQAAMQKGQILARLTSGGKYVVYNSGGSGGAETARAILAQDSDSATSGDVPAKVYLSGHFNSDALTGFKAAAEANFLGTPIFVSKIL